MRGVFLRSGKNVLILTLLFVLTAIHTSPNLWAQNALESSGLAQFGEDLDVQKIFLNNTRTNKRNQAMLVTRKGVNTEATEDPCLVISLGAYGAPYNNKSFEVEAGTWIPVIEEYLAIEPTASVVIPDSAAVPAQERGGAVEAAVGYLTDTNGRTKAQGVGIIAGSLGSIGALNFVANSDGKYRFVKNICLVVFASPWKFLENDLLQRIHTPIATHVGTIDVDEESSLAADQLFNGLDANSPAHLPRERYNYTDGKHGFFVRKLGFFGYDDEAVAAAGEQARAQAFLDLQTAFENMRLTENLRSNLPKKWGMGH